MTTPGPTIHDTEWRAMLMGSEGWSVFAGHRMIASHLSEVNARLIATAPKLLNALQAVHADLPLLSEVEGGSFELLNMVDYAIAKATFEGA